jgi:dipeptidyl aminopeptidase/acylaminoacyl peptidase
LVTLRGHEGTVGAIAFSPNGKHLISGSEDGMVKVWDARINREAVKLAGHQTPVTSVAFSPDGKRIVSTGDDWMVKLWDVESGTEMMLFHTGSHDKAMCPVAFSPDGKLIASSCSRGTIKVWDAETAADVATLSGMGPRSWGVAFSPDSSRVVAASWTMAETSEVVETVIKIWDVRKGVEILNIPLVGSMAMSVAFSPDGQRIVSGAWDGRIRIWEASNGADIMTIKAHEMPIHCVAFSPDGKSIISASGDRTTKIWDAITGTETMTLRGHGDRVVSAQFSPDGKRIITGSNDGTAKLWDAVTGAELLTFPSQRGADDVAFSPDGKTIAVGTFEGRVILWESAPPVGGYETRRNGAAAQKIVDELYKKHNFYYDVIDKLQSDKTLDETMKKLALQIANSRKWEDAEKLKERSWEVVRLSVGDPNAYRAALANAEKANTLEPNDPSIFNLVGAAQYRVGSYEDALKTLTKSEQILSAAGEEPNPANMAFTAMALHQLGRPEQAKVALERLRSLLKDERFAQDEQAKAFLAEAEKLIEGEKH